MSDPIRAALERLIARLDETAAAWVDSYCAARAALAEQQGEGPSESDVAELFYRYMGAGPEAGFENAIAEALSRWGHQPARLRNCPTHGQQPPEAWGCPECVRELREELHRTVPVQPTPPAEGEVAEFITQLKSYAEYGTPIRLIPFVITRAAELLQQQQAKIESLEQQLETERMRVVACGIIAMSDTPFSAAKNRNCHPDYWSASADDIARQIDELMRLRAQQTPVPVSEGLPGAGEMDGSLVWCGSQAAGLPYWEWCLDDIRHPGSSGYTHWLPVNTPALPTALPLPQGEVEE